MKNIALKIKKSQPACSTPREEMRGKGEGGGGFGRGREKLLGPDVVLPAPSKVPLRADICQKAKIAFSLET